MAIDLLILCLLVISFVVNLLALGAFWITPGLRTTANRFTINLLVVNLVGCLILAPSLFLCGKHRYETSNNSSFEIDRSVESDSIELYSKPGNHQLTIRHNGQLVEQEGIILQRNKNNNNSNNKKKNHNHNHSHSHGHGVAPTASTHEQDEQEKNDETIETIYKRNATYYEELTIAKRSDSIVITEFEEAEQQPPSLQMIASTFSPSAQIAEADVEGGGASAVNTPEPLLLPIGTGIRCWSIDLAAALGALAVLLVVGDTWCAVTDPLRYHTRISGVRTWVFIALIWAVGISFGALSALREIDFETGDLRNKQRRFLDLTLEAHFRPIAANDIFGIAFASLYFVVIILLPFGFVCGMYWRIFSEARENGLRMRQNGSSPLLQSALNLTHHQQSSSTVVPLQYANSLCVHRNSISSTSSHGGVSAGGGCGGLQMQIDLRKSSPAHLRRDSAAKVLLPTISDDGGSEDASSPIAEQHEQNELMGHQHQQEHQQQQQRQQQHLDVNGGTTVATADRNQNILLTLQAASGEIKRNYSARQLPLLGTSSQDLCDAGRLPGIRQVHSSPNLQRYAQSHDDSDSLSDDACSPHLLGHHQHAMAHARRFHQLQHNHQHHRSLPQGTSVHPLQHAHHHHHHHHHSHVLQIPAIHASPKALSYMSSLRHRLSNASSLFKYREESRAARISILVVIMFLVSYLPYGFLVLWQSRGDKASEFPHSTQLGVLMILLGTLSSPVIFAYRNKRVRRGVKRFIGRDAASRCRNHSGGSLQRHGSSMKHSSGANIKRNSSKLSTYSSNSCKYLTPQSSLVSNGIVPPTNASLHTLALRPHHTIINFCTLPPKHYDDDVDDVIGGDVGTVEDNHITNNNATVIDAAPVQPLTDGMNLMALEPAERAETPRPPRPILQRGITIVEQIPLGSKFNARHSFFKMFFQSSKNLSCAAAQACSHQPPTEV